MSSTTPHQIKPAGPANGRHLFHSAKTTEPIVYRERWHLIWLLKLSLDDSLVQLTPSSWLLDLPKHQMAVDTIGVNDIYRSRLCSIQTSAVEARLWELDTLDVDLKSDVLASPIKANMQAIWGVRDITVKLDDRLQILKLLEKNGSLSIRQFANELRYDVISTSKFILSLAFQSIVWIDASLPITFDTLVRQTMFSQLNFYVNHSSEAKKSHKRQCYPKNLE